jgi:pyroglutamyl-peptidase
VLIGFEGPLAVTTHVTRYNKFHGVYENLIETIVSNLKEYMKKKSMPKDVILGSCSVFEVIGGNIFALFYQTFQSAIKSKDYESSRLTTPQLLMDILMSTMRLSF